MSESEVKRFVTDTRLWHPWLRINRVLRVMLHMRTSVQDSEESECVARYRTSVLNSVQNTLTASA